MTAYQVVALTKEQEEQLRRVYADLKVLADCDVPSVRAAARAALAHIAQALNGQGMEYDLYTRKLE